MANAPLIAIGIPSGDMVHADFAMNLATMCFNPGARAFIVNAKTSIVALGRNQCAEAAKQAGASHLLFLDSDMIFPPTTLQRLLQHDRDIVGTVYSQRTTPSHPLGVLENGEHKNPGAGLHPMQIIPTGCLLIKMSVFDKLPKPWFSNEIEGEKLRGEDYYFCRQAAKAGYRIWCDGDLSREIGHIGQAVYRIDTVTK